VVLGVTRYAQKPGMEVRRAELMLRFATSRTLQSLQGGRIVPYSRDLFEFAGADAAGYLAALAACAGRMVVAPLDAAGALCGDGLGSGFARGAGAGARGGVGAWPRAGLAGCTACPNVVGRSAPRRSGSAAEVAAGRSRWSSGRRSRVGCRYGRVSCAT